ncbi:MAG TPA: alanine--glyoxylate aminotransferase family protein [Bryobacterales bacterium]|nr:alanine--glyoxylate aminotransferase family protein [Bryobacterales bacterium]
MAVSRQPAVTIMHIRKNRLLTAGPTPLYPPAVRAMTAADLHHRTEDFRRTYKSVLDGLQYFMGTSNDVVLFTASGTGAMESAVSNLFSRGERVLCVVAGKFGERWAEIARAFGLDPVIIDAPYGEAVPAARVAEALRNDASLRGVFVQATESSTGAAHDIEGMAAAVRQSDALLVVDAITGLGTSVLDIDGWGLDVVIGGSQKALMVPPGLAFLSVSPKAWARAETANLPHYYFDLRKEKKSGDKGESSWTPATAVVLALAESLRYIRELGRDKLIENAQLLARATRAAVTELGLDLFAPHAPAGALTAVCAPPGVDSGLIVKRFREQFGSIINNGQGSMKGRIFRIAHLGYFDFPDLFAVIAELELILHELGRPVELGTGVRAAQQVYVEARQQQPALAAR